MRSEKRKTLPMMLAACLTASPLLGCANGSREYCLLTETIYIDPADVLTDATARQILRHDETRAKRC